MRLFERAFLVLLLSLLSCFSIGVKAAPGPREITVVMTEYRFQPDTISLRVGETVVLTLINDSSQGREHVFAVGRNARFGGPFGDRAESFATDFFVGLEVEVLEGGGVSALTAGKAKMRGDQAQQWLAATRERHDIFYVELAQGGFIKLRFTVPADKAGSWESACFAEDGEHYAEGMRGKVVVSK